MYWHGFVHGMTVALLPSAIFLAWALWRARKLEGHDDD
jgi:hypothetical protein